MSLATEGRYDLAVDTDALRHAGAQYSEIADNLRRIAERLDNCLMDLKDSSWTTGAGKAFQTMVSTGWKDNVEKYADLLDTLRKIMEESAGTYDDLIQEVERTKL